MSSLETSRPDNVSVIVRRFHQSPAPLEEKVLARHESYQHQEDEDGGHGGDTHDNAHCLLRIQTVGRSRFYEKKSSSINYTLTSTCVSLDASIILVEVLKHSVPGSSISLFVTVLCALQKDG